MDYLVATGDQALVNIEACKVSHFCAELQVNVEVRQKGTTEKCMVEEKWRFREKWINSYFVDLGEKIKLSALSINR